MHPSLSRRNLLVLASSLLIALVATGSIVYGGSFHTAQLQLAGAAAGLVPCVGWQDCTACALVKLIQNIINFIVFAAFLVTMISFARAGFLYMTSAANPAQITKAWTIFKRTAIGFAIAVSAYLIVDTVMHALLTNSTTIPAASWNQIGVCPVNRVLNTLVPNWLLGKFTAPVTVGVGSCSNGTLTNNGTCQQSDGTFSIPYGYACGPSTNFDPKTGNCIGQDTGVSTGGPVQSFVYGGGTTSGRVGTAQCSDDNPNCSLSAIQQAASGQNIDLTQAQTNALSCIAVTENGGNAVGCSGTGPCGTFQINRQNWNTYAPSGCTGLSNQNNGACNLKVALILFNKSGYQPWTGTNPNTGQPWNANARVCVQNYDPTANI